MAVDTEGQGLARRQTASWGAGPGGLIPGAESGAGAI